MKKRFTLLVILAMIFIMTVCGNDEVEEWINAAGILNAEAGAL